MMGLPIWQMIAGGAAVAIVSFGFWLVLNNAKKRGRAEAERDASEAARELENEMKEIAGKKVTSEEVIERIKNKQFGGPKP